MDKKILAAGMQKGFVGVVVAYFLAIALGILAGIWENHYFNDRRAVHKHGLH